MSAGQFFIYWLSFSLLVLAAAGLVIVWAFRNGLFKDQDRARYLALWAEIPVKEQKSKGAKDEG